MTMKDDIILPSQGDNIIRTKDSQRSVDPNGLAHALYVALKNHKDKIGQIDGETGIQETFGVMLERAVRVACHLKKLGVTSEDILTPCTTNHLNTSIIFHAILFTGAKVASLDPFAPDEDRIRQLELVKPKFLFAVSETVEAVEKMIGKLGLNTKIVVFGKTQKHIPFDDFLVPLPNEERVFSPHIVKDIFDTALIVFSSGSTGSPKGICIHHYAAMGDMGLSLNGQPQIILSFASLVWGSAILSTILTTLEGGVKILASGFETEKAWNYLEKYKVTFALFAPQDLVALVKNGKPNGLNLPHLKRLFPAGGAISLKTMEKLREMFSQTLIITGYGQTEIWGAALTPPYTPEGISEYLNKPGTCGRPTKGFTYKIADPETGKILGPNQPGEICIKSKCVMNGYYKMDSSHRLDKDGFLKTGDILYYDEDYWFFFVERHKEMLRYKMTAIAPTELEAILVEHPSVKLVVVIGIPTDEGDLATALVVKKDNNVTAEELEALVASKVDERKKLGGGVKFVEENEIPFTPSGKIRRRALKQYILDKI